MDFLQVSITHIIWHVIFVQCKDTHFFLFLMYFVNVHVWLKFSTTKHHYENEKNYNIETKDSFNAYNMK
jgi:hypothetical protein